LQATTQRAPGAAAAVSHTGLEASGVAVMGQGARLDEHGLTLNGSPSPLNGPLNQLIGMLNTKDSCTPDPPVGVPNLPTLPVSTPVLRVGQPTLSDKLGHHGNERSVSMSGLTICLASITPVPNASSNPVSPTPTIYTITLGNVSSSAYGVSLPADAGLGGQFAPDLSGTLDGGAGTGAIPPSTTTAVNPGAGGGTTPAAGSAHGGAFGGLLATLTGGILSPKVVVTVATLAEMALLGTLWLSYRLAAARRDDESPSTRMDLV
jgi:hypothetical protein